MKLSDWARKQGISYITAWRWFKGSKLPVAARQLPTGTILVDEPNPEGRTVLYARISSADQKDDLQRQVQRLQVFAREQGWTEFEVVAEIGSGLDGKRKKLLRVLHDPRVARIVVEHRDRLARFGFDAPRVPSPTRTARVWNPAPCTSNRYMSLFVERKTIQRKEAPSWCANS